MRNTATKPDRIKCSWKITALVTLGILVISLFHLSPLLGYFNQAIPFSYVPYTGYDRMPLVPGDHLQFYYWSWIMVDNLFGPSQFFTNPYEFNTFLSAGTPVFANFPFSLLYVAFYPLGPVSAYNILVIISYVLAGLFAFLLAREVLEDWLPALPAAFLYAFLPFRAAQTLSGHLNGFVAFLVPMCLFCLERGFKRKSWFWGLLAGFSVFIMSLMEGHLVYYTTLFLGLYLPLRIAFYLKESPAEDAAKKPEGGLAFIPLAVGLVVGVAAHLQEVRAGRVDFVSVWLASSLFVYMVSALSAWLLGSWLITSLTGLDLAKARRLAARSMLPLAVLGLYPLQVLVSIPRLGTLLSLAAVLGSSWLLLPALWRNRRRTSIPWARLAPVWTTAFGVAAGAAYMMHIKSKVFNASIASKGRTLEEVKLFAPTIKDFFDASNIHVEGFLYLGLGIPLLALAAIILMAAFRQGARPKAYLAGIWAALAVLLSILCMGPRLPGVHLYAFLYKYMPFFNFPRVPGRLFLYAALMFMLLACWGLKQLLPIRAPKRRSAALAAMALALAAFFTWDLWPPLKPGICLIPPPGPIEQGVRAHLPTGPNAEKRLLGLPIWPGDSHQSSAYEYIITNTRALTINGYAPVTPSAYRDKIYWPLDPLNRGETSAEILELLKKNKVGLIAFMDDEQIYPRKISPYPPSLARKRLLSANAVSYLGQAGNCFFMGVDHKAPPGPPAGRVTSLVTSLWEAHFLRCGTGRLVEDKHASGWGLLFKQPATPLGPLGPRLERFRGNVAVAKAGLDEPGALSYGPYQTFPSGSYTAYFRLRRGKGGGAPGHIDVSAESGKIVLAKSDLTPELLPPDEKWHDVAIDFGLDKSRRLELRTYFNGKSDLALDVVLVKFADRAGMADFYPAAELWRQTGDLAKDDRVPGGQAVKAKAGWHPPLYLMHGPQQTLEPGSYRAGFRLAKDGDSPPKGPLTAELVVATDLGQRVLGHRMVQSGQLGGDYRDFTVDFKIPRRCEIGLRVLYREGADLLLAGANIKRLP